MIHFSKPIRCLALLLAFAFVATELYAQDPRFSQYYASPWNLNPAMSGVFNGRWRINANYRDQWNSVLSPVPFRTYAASYDYRFNVGYNDDYASFGFGAMHDEAGTARFSQNKAQIGGSFIKQLSGGYRQASHYLAAGAQLGMGQHSLDWGKLWFSRQFDLANERPDASLSSGEGDINGSTNLYLDFNAGLMWYTLFGENGFVYAGISGQHLNRPDVAFVNNSGEAMYQRWSAHAGGQLPLNDNISLLPGVLLMKQGPSFETDLGLNLRYSNNDYNELALRFGAWGRIGNRLNSGVQMDAVTVVGMLEYNRYMLGLSYDITVSNLTLANNARGAFEVSFTYFHPGERKSRVICPKL